MLYASKILTTIVHKRIKRKIYENLTEDQFEFIEGIEELGKQYFALD